MDSSSIRKLYEFGTDITRNDIFICLILFSTCLLAGLSQMVPSVCGVFHDDGIYILTAKALAKGEGYRLINLPDNLFQTKYPPLYPILIALIWTILPSFPKNTVVMQLVNIFLSAITISICYLYFNKFKYFSNNIIVCSLLICSTSPFFLYFTSLLSSEMLFFFLYCLMLWYFDYLITQQSNATRFQYVILGIVISLPFLCRTVGLIFIPIALLLLLIHKRRLTWTLLGILIAALPWLLCQMSASLSAGYEPVRTYYTDYTGWWIRNGFKHIIDVSFINFINISISMLSTSLWGVYKSLPYNLNPIFFLLGMIPFIDMILQKQNNISLRYFLGGYLLLVCIWPWPSQRFLVPIMPFILCYFFNRIYLLLTKSELIAKIPIFSSMIIIFLIFNINSLLNVRQIHSATRYPYLGTISTVSNYAHWSSFEKVFQWLKVNSSKKDVIASNLDSMLYLYTDRKSFRPFAVNPTSLFYGKDGPKVGTTTEFKECLNKYKPKYLVQMAMPGFAEEKPFNDLIELFRKENPQCLKPVCIGDDRRFIIYRVQY